MAAVPAALAAKIEEWMAHYGVPGVAVGVYHNGEEQIGAWGVTSVLTQQAVTTDTLFQIGSTSKTFCGTAAQVLAEQGRLDLDAPLRTYLPDLHLKDADATAQATMRHCLTHVGGWLGDYFDDTGSGNDALAHIVGRMAELPQVAPLGTMWSYNNAGFYLAGRAIEAVTGQTYEDALHELVIAPLGLTRTLFFARNAITERFAVGHTTAMGQPPTVARPWELPRSANAAGGLLADLPDQLAYARFHLGDGTSASGKRILSEAGLKGMQQPLVDKGRDGQMALSWQLGEMDGVRIVRHGGATNGQLSAFQMVPERGFAVAVLTNANRGVELHGQVVKWTLEHYCGLHEPEQTAVPMAPDALAAYVGIYAAPLSDIAIAHHGGELIAQVMPKGGFPNRLSQLPPPPPPTRVEFIGADWIRATDEPFAGNKAEFLRDPDGSVGWLRWGGRAARKQ